MPPDVPLAPTCCVIKLIAQLLMQIRPDTPSRLRTRMITGDERCGFTTRIRNLQIAPTAKKKSQQGSIPPSAFFLKIGIRSHCVITAIPSSSMELKATPTLLITLCRVVNYLVVFVKGNRSFGFPHNLYLVEIATPPHYFATLNIRPWIGRFFDLRGFEIVTDSFVCIQNTFYGHIPRE